jgi:hypothetical protein
MDNYTFVKANLFVGNSSGFEILAGFIFWTTLGTFIQALFTIVSHIFPKLRPQIATKWNIVISNNKICTKAQQNRGGKKNSRNKHGIFDSDIVDSLQQK